MYLPEKIRMVSTQGDVNLAIVEDQLAKYLERAYDIVQCKHPKTHGLTPTEVFHGIQKVIDAQLSLEVTEEAR